jgi:hypothetical protein
LGKKGAKWEKVGKRGEFIPEKWQMRFDMTK